MATATTKTTPARKPRTVATKPTTTREKAAAAGARVPQDRAQKAEATGEFVVLNVLDVDVTVDPEALDDYDAVEAFADGDPRPFLRIIAGSEEREKEILQELREESGRLRASVVGEFIMTVLKEAGQGKS